MVPDRAVQELTVVADHDRRLWVLAQPRFEPERALEVEVVGRLVQQQEVGFGEKGGGQRHAHAPAAGELGHRTVQVWVTNPSPVQDLRGARGRAVGVDLGQPRGRSRRGVRAGQSPARPSAGRGRRRRPAPSP